MATPGADDLDRAFALYFREMDRCVSAACYFALLHVILALPDVCAALETPGAHIGERYRAWCRRYLNDPLVSPDEFYKLRCALLHQGQAVGSGRYSTYSFAVQSGVSVHRLVVPAEKNITLDPRHMATEMRRAVELWFNDLRIPTHAARLTAVRTNLQSIVREQRELPGIGGIQFMVQSST
jgi:hypothetical protein